MGKTGLPEVSDSSPELSAGATVQEFSPSSMSLVMHFDVSFSSVKQSSISFTPIIIYVVVRRECGTVYVLLSALFH